MYSLSDLKRAFEHPEALAREVNRIYHTRGKRRPYNTAGIDIFDEDWDTLIVLDSCRYNVFARTVDIAGRLERRISRGSTTYEWVTANFSDKTLHDTVYVSSNLWYSRLEDDINADVHDFIRTEPHDEGLNFNPAAQDVFERGMHPRTVTRRAIEAAERYPQKRLIVHYMQPHQPYIGPTGDRHFEPDGNSIQRLSSGERTVSNELIYDAYRENLEIALDTLPDLLERDVGKAVITADHGEMLGDRYSPFPFVDYGHNPGLYCKQLVTVPWLVVEGKQRRKIVVEKPTGRSYQPDQEEIESSPRDLGYVM